MYFTEERINRTLQELSNYIFNESRTAASYEYLETNIRKLEELNSHNNEWKIFNETDRWGGKNKHFWFKTQIVIPEEFDGRTVVLEIKTGREGDWDAINPQFLAYVNGQVKQGLDVNHRHIILTSSAVGGEIYDIMLHAFSGMKEGLVELTSKLSILNREIEKVYFDIKVSYDAAMLLGKDDNRRIDTISILNEAINILDFRKPFSKEFISSIENTEDFLEEKIYSINNADKSITAYSTGHTHIDVAWLWTLSQTREKAIRSFSTVLTLMELYPDYVFMSTQPQLYKFIKEDHPEVYDKIKQRVKEGRWEPEGAMWIEPDCNLISGESFIRQLLFGSRFFEKEFGVKNKILWLPDVFGFSGAMPQILKKSGIECFMTTKLKWNEYNLFPYDTFMWKGIDGSEILSYFTIHHGAFLGPESVNDVWKTHKQKSLNKEILVPFGYGDGGGGATSEMLENGKRLVKGIPGCPTVKLGKFADFVESLKLSVSHKKKLPKWVGELYFEWHRGTYTSIAKNKKYNRKSEFLYQDAELLSVMANDITSQTYPRQKLNSGWESILLNQFHDILPGSSIKEVYDESTEQYLSVIADGKDMVNQAMNSIAKNIALENKAVVVFNQLGFDRSDLVEFEMPSDWENAEVYDLEGRLCDSQLTAGSKVVFYAENIPAKGYKTFKIARAANKEAKHGDIYATAKELNNRFFNIKLDDNGNIISIFDKTNKREVLKNGEKGNMLQAFEDMPVANDAWDINLYYQEKMWEIDQAESIEVVETGSIRSTLRIKRRFVDSVIIQDICVYNDIPRVDFINKIDWKEKFVVLKAAFPVDVHADKATYDIQFGNIERPTHWNTSWDYAKFEVCGHKWADMSENGYGVSLMNDCKYGYDIKDSLMRLTLIKSAMWPNPEADKEVHEFTYSLYPHNGDWRNGGTVQRAYELNCPMYTKVEDEHAGSLPKELSYINCDSENVFIETVKKAEDSEDIIIRVYECFNRRATAKVSLYKNVLSVKECDMMENEIGPCKSEGNSFEFTIEPYEIKTFKLSI
jgi:alpha-mannosidase